MIVRDLYQFQRRGECVDILRSAQVFSALDANRAYYQIEFKETDKAKTAFTMHHGICQFTCIPFGIRTPLSRSSLS